MSTPESRWKTVKYLMWAVGLAVAATILVGGAQLMWGIIQQLMVMK